MKSLRKLLWIQLFLLSVLSTTSILVEINPLIKKDHAQVVEHHEGMFVNN